jgi:transcriptional antiterminator NusG
MFMQRQSEFRGATIFIDEHADWKQDLAIRENMRKNRNIAMAGRAIMADSEGGAGWVCLEVQDRHELAVEKRLLAADVMAFVPHEKDRMEIRRGRKWTIPKTPIMSGYVLVRCLLDAHAFMGLLSVKGVLGLVGGALRPWRVNDKIMRVFIAMHDDGSLQKLVADTRLKVGDKVFVKAGPWVGSNGEIVQMPKVKKKGPQKLDCKVSMDMFGGKVEFVMPLAFVEKL